MIYGGVPTGLLAYGRIYIIRPISPSVDMRAHGEINPRIEGKD